MVLVASAALGVVGGNELRYPDEGDYIQLAQSVRSDQGYVGPEGTPTAYRPPGWPLVLSVLYSLHPQPLTAKLFNALAYACVAWLLSIAVARVVPQGRVFAPLLLLMYPVGLYTSATLYPQTLGTLLFIIVLHLLHNRKRIPLKSVMAGILFGVLVLSIPAFLLLSPFIIIGLFLTRTPESPRPALHATLFLLCALLVVAPWTLRNARVFDRFIPVSTNSGVNLLLGNSENSGPNKGVNVDIARYIEEADGMREDEKDAYYKKCALSWVREHPSAAVKLYALKVLNYFNFRNELFVKSEASQLRDLILATWYYPLLLIALIRLFAFRRYRISRFELGLYLLYFGNAFVSAIFFTRIRFRVPMDAILIAIVSIFLGHLLRTLIERRTKEVQPA